MTERQLWYQQVYLQSSWWLQRRQQAIKEGERRCNHCKSEIELHVHHLNYRHLGEEQKGDLEVLCEVCHTKEHIKQKYIKLLLTSYPPIKSLEDIKLDDLGIPIYCNTAY